MKEVKELVSDVTEEERRKFMYELTGQDFTKDIDYSSIKVNEEWTNELKRDQAREEMVQYLTECLKKEYHLDSAKDALLKWEDYKEKHGIRIE